jgi:hypothetical protein
MSVERLSTVCQTSQISSPWLSDEFLERVITGDESWIYEYDIELKLLSREWKQKESPRLKNHGKANQK